MARRDRKARLHSGLIGWALNRIHRCSKALGSVKHSTRDGRIVQPGPRVTDAADLKFLQWLPLPRDRNFKSKCGIRKIELLVTLWFSEVRARGCRNGSRTSETGHQCDQTGAEAGGVPLQKVSAHECAKMSSVSQPC